MGDLPTTEQTRTLLALIDLRRELGDPPSESVIAERQRVSRINVHNMLGELRTKGMITPVGEGWHKRYEVTPAGVAWAKMTRTMVNGDPPKKKRSKKKIR